MPARMRRLENEPEEVGLGWHESVALVSLGTAPHGHMVAKVRGLPAREKS